MGLLFFISFVVAFQYSSYVLESVSLSHAREAVSFSGSVRVVSSVSTSGYFHSVRAVIEQCDLSLEKCLVGERVLVSYDPFISVSHGDVLSFSCDLAPPENFSDDFDWRMFLAKDGVYLSCRTDSGLVVSDHDKSFLSSLFLWRQNLESHVNRLISQPYSALANGLLFGGDDRLPDETAEAFRRTGMTHIVAVSGYNVVVISSIVLLVGIFCGLWRQQALFLALFSIVFFVVIIGSSSSAIRAGVMGVLVLLAMASGHIGHSLRALFLAAFFMLIYNPLSLRWDVGFQLSFLATLGIILFLPFFSFVFHGFRERFSFLFDLVFVTLSAQIFVLPIILFHFGTVSLVSFFVNMFVLPLIPFTMFFVFLTVFFAVVFPSIAFLFAWCAHFFLVFEVSVIEWFSTFSWASVSWVGFSSISLLLVYLFLICFVGGCDVLEARGA